MAQQQTVQHSVRDHDNDGWDNFNCAEKHHGAQGFGNQFHRFTASCATEDLFCDNFPVGKDCAVCADSNLNGNYSSQIYRGTNIFWDYFSGIDCGLQYTDVKVGPIKTQQVTITLKLRIIVKISRKIFRHISVLL